MSKVTEKHHKLSPKARAVPKDQRHAPPLEAHDPRNIKVRITMYVDLDVLNYFKERSIVDGQPYQTQMNAELRGIMASQQGGNYEADLRQARGLIDAALRKIG